MALNVAASKNALAGKFATDATWIAITTASPGAGPAVSNEATGGGYARQQTTWGSASGGVVTGSQVTVPLAAGTYTHIAICTASTGSTLYEWYPLGTSLVLSVAGNVLVTPSFTES